MQVFPASMAAQATALPSDMQAVVAVDGEAVLVTRSVPVPGEGEVLLKVASTAINRADTMQRKGKVPPPPGVTDIMGLECAGTVVAHGDKASGSAADLPPVGSQVMALLSGGERRGGEFRTRPHFIVEPAQVATLSM